MKKSRTSLPTLFNRPLQTADPSALSHTRSEPAIHYFYTILILPKISSVIKFILFSYFPIWIGIGFDVSFPVLIVIDAFVLVLVLFVFVFLNLCNLRDLRKKFLSSSYLLLIFFLSFSFLLRASAPLREIFLFSRLLLPCDSVSLCENRLRLPCFAKATQGRRARPFSFWRSRRIHILPTQLFQ